MQRFTRTSKLIGLAYGAFLFLIGSALQTVQYVVPLIALSHRIKF